MPTIRSAPPSEAERKLRYRSARGRFESSEVKLIPALTSNAAKRFKSRAVGTIINLAPMVLLSITKESNAEMGSNFGGNKWKVAEASDFGFDAVAVSVRPFSATATRGGIALRITSYGEPPQKLAVNEISSMVAWLATGNSPNNL